MLKVFIINRSSPFLVGSWQNVLFDVQSFFLYIKVHAIPHFQFFIYSTIRFSYFAFYKWDNVVCNDINATNDILMSKEMDYSSMH